MIKVQGLSTTIKELESIVKELKKELNDPFFPWKLYIINKENKSDGCKFEWRKS